MYKYITQTIVCFISHLQHLDITRSCLTNHLWKINAGIPPPPPAPPPPPPSYCIGTNTLNKYVSYSRSPRLAFVDCFVTPWRLYTECWGKHQIVAIHYRSCIGMGLSVRTVFFQLNAARSVRAAARGSVQPDCAQSWVMHWLLPATIYNKTLS